jgi:hypothetical protein
MGKTQHSMYHNPKVKNQSTLDSFNKSKPEMEILSFWETKISFSPWSWDARSRKKEGIQQKRLQQQKLPMNDG